MIEIKRLSIRIIANEITTYKKRQASDILTSRDQSSVTTAASQKNNCLSDTGRNEELSREPRPPVSTNKDNIGSMQGLTLIEYRSIKTRTLD